MARDSSNGRIDLYSIKFQYETCIQLKTMTILIHNEMLSSVEHSKIFNAKEVEVCFFQSLALGLSKINIELEK